MAFVPPLTDAEIGDFLGNIELHLIQIKSAWERYLTITDTVLKTKEKAETIISINRIQQILNTIKSSLAISLPTTDLSDTEIVQFGIMPE
ncbi:MAG: hypothetical protein KGI08_09720 [Thaumarchaeota archaeon]|nr:hypothetical protein [Nitrososphaerota archaeon]